MCGKQRPTLFLKFITTHPNFIHKQIKKNCLDLTSPLRENELNGPILDENELIFFFIILSECIFFTLRQTIAYWKMFENGVGTGL